MKRFAKLYGMEYGGMAMNKSEADRLEKVYKERAAGDKI